MKELDAITFADEKFYPSEMYLQDNQLVVVGKARAGTYYQGFDTKSVDPEYYYDGGSAKVYVFDISNKANIKIKREVSFEGEYSSSRMIDGVVYLTVTQNNYYQPWSKNHAWKEADLVPLYLENGKLDKLVSCKDINYMPESVNDSNFLILAGVPTDPKKPISSEVVMGEVG